MVKARPSWTRAAAALILATAFGTDPAAAQEDSVTVVAGPGYAAGWLHRALLGADYRAAWTAPVRVPVLDLARFAGGLTPVRRGGGVQTASLRFEAGDGREYGFRSVDKSYDHSVPEWARGTVLQWLRRDQTSAQHPGAALVATPLLEAAGILNPGPRLVVMPDDPRLGEYREEFAGMLGTIELHANEGENDEPLFAGSPKIAGGETVLEHLAEEPSHRVDGAAFLAERLMSVYLNDWDRHIGQYRFARYERDGVFYWVPVPEDRDYAFVDHDGLLLAVARAGLTNRMIRWRDRYPSLMAMLSNSQDLARQLLADVDRSTWDSVAVSVHSRLTDDAIDRAVGAQPAPWRERTAAELAAGLRARRDRFRDMSDRFYAMMAAYPEIHGTAAGDRLVVERAADGSIDVRLSAPGNAAWGDRPYYQRRFHPEETEEVRVFLSGGHDQAVIRGAASPTILVRVVGGEGDDVLVDSAGGVVFYDAEGDNRIETTPRSRVSRRPYVRPEEEFSLLPNSPRDWGSELSWFVPELGWISDVGVVAGGGPLWTVYGFRHHPYAAAHGLSALVAPGSSRGAVRYAGEVRSEGSPRWVELAASASNLEVLRFHGPGNASPPVPYDSAVSTLRRYAAGATWQVMTPRGVTLSFGPWLSYADPELGAGTPLDRLRPPGATGWGEAGLGGRVEMDRRDDPGFPRRGITASVGVDGLVPFRENTDPYAISDIGFTGFLSAPGPVPAIVAVRAGGSAVLGTAPVHSMATLGGRHDLRGFSQDRFRGDAEAHATAELRVPLFPARFVARGVIGVSGFADAGRVWVDGSSPGGWHSAAGAGLWFATPPATVAVEYARGEKDTFYLRLGLGLGTGR